MAGFQMLKPVTFGPRNLFETVTILYVRETLLYHVGIIILVNVVFAPED
jgi:hypothetical protein